MVFPFSGPSSTTSFALMRLDNPTRSSVDSAIPIIHITDMKNRRDAAALLDAVREKSFTPSVRDVDALIELLKTANDERVQAVQNAILRVGRPAAACLLAR